ncbi:outer membrane protein assembly factor BamD [Desulfospira joergensenii]|uniref:outer membrane protein assembly factor BamD n=1 Tax=Desulfospira joergensenii TaxID=53329 RepID=UPI001FC93AEA|nr:outer membrane protein assembly factor BamD [Desulfospira joergensenii]
MAGLFLALLISGCGFFDDDGPRQMEKNAEQLAAEGASEFMNENYTAAIRSYTDLKDWYPFSKYAILAELKIADAHFRLEEYDEAVLAYEDFEKLHPRNEAVPYVIHQTGLCWFNQIGTVDRDHAPAMNAMAQFRRLMEQFPQSEYAQDAPDNIEKCINNIAGHELYVADFYLKTKKYKAALKRYQYIVEFYPQAPQSQKALEKIPECTELVKEAELAKAEEEKED